MLAFYICLVINYQQIKNNSMKPSILVIAAIVFSATSFAQTTVSNQQTVKNTSSVQTDKGSNEIKNSASATSSTKVKSGEANSASKATATEVSQEKGAATAEKNELGTKASTTEKNDQKFISNEHNVFADGQSDTHVLAKESNNKTQVNSSLNGNAAVSTTGTTAASNQIKNETKSNIEAFTEVTVKNANKVKAALGKTEVMVNNKVSTSAATGVKTSAAVVHSVKPAATIKMNSQIKTAGNIIIK